MFKKVGEIDLKLKDPNPKFHSPQESDYKLFLQKLAEMPGPPAAILLVAPGHAQNYVPDFLKRPLPKPLGIMYDNQL